MPRSMPKFPTNVPATINPHPDMVTRTYKIEVITPLFGGGVEAGKVDPEHPIRESAIRGHLRFWWRVTRGLKYSSVDALRQRESEIWGSSTNPSPVIIEVEQPKEESLQPRYPPNYEFSKYGPESYVLFSAKDKEVPICKENFSFTLHVYWLDHDTLKQQRRKENEELKRAHKEPKPDTIDDIGPDVEYALKTWVNFGGIGARTRRGCGALYCHELSLKTMDECKDYPFTVLFNNSAPHANPLQSWNKSVEAIRSFRQLRSGGSHTKIIPTHKGTKVITVPASRSYWPEPDSIRKITGCALKPPNLNSSDHSVPVTPTVYFPRAEFGLPIIFHFADGPAKKMAASPVLDPPEVTLIPTRKGDKPDERKDGTRMASPVITRPLKLNAETCVSIIVILKFPDLPVLRLTGKLNSLPKDFDPKKVVRNKNLANYNNSPLGLPALGKIPRSEEGSALKAFIAFAQERPNNFEVVGNK